MLNKIGQDATLMEFTFQKEGDKEIHRLMNSVSILRTLWASEVTLQSFFSDLLLFSLDCFPF